MPENRGKTGDRARASSLQDGRKTKGFQGTLQREQAIKIRFTRLRAGQQKQFAASNAGHTKALNKWSLWFSSDVEFDHDTLGNRHLVSVLREPRGNFFSNPNYCLDHVLVEFSPALVLGEIAGAMRIAQNADFLVRNIQCVLEAFKYNVSIYIWPVTHFLKGRERKCMSCVVGQIELRLFIELLILRVLEFISAT